MFQIDPAFFPRSVESRTKVLCTLCDFYILQLIITKDFFFFDLTVCLNLDSLSVVSFCTNPAFAYPIVRREFILESWLKIQLNLRDLSLYVLQLDILCEYRSIYSQVLVASFLAVYRNSSIRLETLKACNI